MKAKINGQEIDVYPVENCIYEVSSKNGKEFYQSVRDAFDSRLYLSNRDAKVIRISFKPFSESKAKEASILGDIKAGYTYENFAGIEEFYWKPKQPIREKIINCLEGLWEVISDYSFPIIWTLLTLLVIVLFAIAYR